MARTYIMLSKDEQDDKMAEAMLGLEMDLRTHDSSAEGYAMQLQSPALANLPDAWPDDIVKFRGKQVDQVLAMGATPEQAERAMWLSRRDRVRHLLFTEKLGGRQCELTYNVLLNQFPPGLARDAACARIKAKLLKPQ